jgi:hypothetical protein
MLPTDDDMGTELSIAPIPVEKLCEFLIWRWPLCLLARGDANPQPRRQKSTTTFYRENVLGGFDWAGVSAGGVLRRIRQLPDRVCFRLSIVSLG